MFLLRTQVVFIKAIRAKSYHSNIPPHDYKFGHSAADPSERVLGTQVLLDILLLARCDHFLHTESSVASLASYFNPHMTSHYLMDETSAKVPLNRLESLSEYHICFTVFLTASIYTLFPLTTLLPKPRFEWNPIRSVIIRVINRIGRPRLSPITNKSKLQQNLRKKVTVEFKCFDE